MLAMPVASHLTDRIGAARVVLAGVACVAASVLVLVMLQNTSPLWMIELALFLQGLGKGSTMMPATSAALSSLRKHEIARATSGLNVLQRAGGALGTALLAVVLTRGISGFVPGASLYSDIPSAVAASAPPWLGQVFSQVFGWALGIVLLAGCAALFLPNGMAKVRGGEEASGAGPGP
jgi:MFS family permease